MSLSSVQSLFTDATSVNPFGPRRTTDWTVAMPRDSEVLKMYDMPFRRRGFQHTVARGTASQEATVGIILQGTIDLALQKHITIAGRSEDVMLKVMAQIYGVPATANSRVSNKSCVTYATIRSAAETLVKSAAISSDNKAHSRCVRLASACLTQIVEKLGHYLHTGSAHVFFESLSNEGSLRDPYMTALVHDAIQSSPYAKAFEVDEEVFNTISKQFASGTWVSLTAMVRVAVASFQRLINRFTNITEAFERTAQTYIIMQDMLAGRVRGFSSWYDHSTVQRARTDLTFNLLLNKTVNNPAAVSELQAVWTSRYQQLRELEILSSEGLNREDLTKISELARDVSDYEVLLGFDKHLDELNVIFDKYIEWAPGRNMSSIFDFNKVTANDSRDVVAATFLRLACKDSLSVPMFSGMTFSHEDSDMTGISSSLQKVSVAVSEAFTYEPPHVDTDDILGLLYQDALSWSSATVGNHALKAAEAETKGDNSIASLLPGTSALCFSDLPYMHSSVREVIEMGKDQGTASVHYLLYIFAASFASTVNFDPEKGEITFTRENSQGDLIQCTSQCSKMTLLLQPDIHETTNPVDLLLTAVDSHKGSIVSEIEAPIPDVRKYLGEDIYHNDEITLVRYNHNDDSSSKDTLSGAEIRRLLGSICREELRAELVAAKVDEAEINKKIKQFVLTPVSVKDSTVATLRSRANGRILAYKSRFGTQHWVITPVYIKGIVGNSLMHLVTKPLATFSAEDRITFGLDSIKWLNRDETRALKEQCERLVFGDVVSTYRRTYFGRLSDVFGIENSNADCVRELESHLSKITHRVISENINYISGVTWDKYDTAFAEVTQSQLREWGAGTLARAAGAFGV